MSTLVGFEVGSAKRVEVSPSHLIVTGVTQLSGKTTTLEALITRSGKKAIVFSTKPGEASFQHANECFPFFKERSDWQFVASLLEATMNERMKFERAWIINACQGTSTLKQVQEKIQGFLANAKLSEFNRNIYTTLNEYFKIITPQIEQLKFTKELILHEGINVMYLEGMSDEIQSLVIRSVLENVLKEKKDVVVVIPEAWKFLPQGKGNPCKHEAEKFIRQGAANRNYLWIDSQDMTGVDKTPLKMVSTWIMGLQTEMNEVKRTIEQMPIPKKDRPPIDKIMTLDIGHFFVCAPQSGARLTYVQPVWMDESDARGVAEGRIKITDIKKRSVDYPVRQERVYSDDEPTNTWAEKLIDAIAQELLRRQALTAVIGVDFASSGELEKLRKEWNAFLPRFEKIENYVCVDNAANAIFPAPTVDEIVQRVLREIPRFEGKPIVQVAPIEALKQQFLVEAKERIIASIKALPEAERKALKFVEAAARGISHKDMCEKCFGRPSAGGSSDAVKKIVMYVVDLGLLRRDKNATTYPMLKERITSELGFHDAKPEEVDLLYAHVINELL